MGITIKELGDMDEKILETIMQLRRETGAGLAVCSESLRETNGDFEKAKEIARELKLKAQFPDSEIAMAARRPGVTGLGMKFEYPDGTVRDKWGNIIKNEKE